MLGLVGVLGSAYSNPFAQAFIYQVVATLGMLTGSTSMALMVLPQWRVIRKNVRRAGRWPAAIMLRNGAVISLLYAAFAYTWRFGG